MLGTESGPPATFITMTKRIALTATVIAALAAAVPALATVTVYSNNFKSKASYKAITKQSGKKKRCKREWRKKSSLGVTVKGGRQNCALKTPVSGDSPQPDLIVRAETKITGATEKAARNGAFIGVSVRSGRKHGYVFRVIPKRHRWELVEDKVVLDKGQDGAVEGIKKKNVLEIRAKGDTIVGKVNGKSMISYRDPAPDDIASTGTGLVYGNVKKVKKKKAVGFFDKLRVGVPNP